MWGCSKFVFDFNLDNSPEASNLKKNEDSILM